MYEYNIFVQKQLLLKKFQIARLSSRFIDIAKSLNEPYPELLFFKGQILGVFLVAWKKLELVSYADVGISHIYNEKKYLWNVNSANLTVKRKQTFAFHKLLLALRKQSP